MEDSREDSKEIIARVALGLFARRGFESVGVNEIAEKTGFSKPTLYYHFGSKEGLLEGIIETRGKALLALTEEGAEYHRDIRMNLKNLFEDTTAFALENQDFFRLLLRLFASAPETPGSEIGGVLRGKLIRSYRNLFLRAAEDHGNMRNREEIYAETFWGLISTCALLSMNGVLSLDPASRFRILHQYMHGIFS